jgi:hypothetical protein
MVGVVCTQLRQKEGEVERLERRKTEDLGSQPLRKEDEVEALG